MTTICEVDGNGLMTKAGHLTGLTYKLELLMRVSEDARRTKHFLGRKVEAKLIVTLCRGE